MVSFTPTSAGGPLAGFTAATRDWFTGAFQAPTTAQEGAWKAISSDQHVLVVAPTGSGKTLAAFLWAVDRLLVTEPVDAMHRCRVVYVSPLKALVADVERNLRSPLVGIRRAAARTGQELREVRVGARTGDTPANERRKFAVTPPDILVTTPESLYLILTSAARSGLAGVHTVIIDEIHAVAGTKRGAHLALTLERLDAFLEAQGERPAQRIGLSATVRPVAEVTRYLAGSRPPHDGGRATAVVQPPADKRLRIDLVVPVADLSDPDATPLRDHPPGPQDPAEPGPGSPDQQPRRASVWPHVEERVVDLVAAHHSTLVFTNSRRGAERLTSRMNELWAARNGLQVPDPSTVQPSQVHAQSGAASGVEPIIARAHHGSMSRAERTRTESELKEGRLPAVVATSSLELGIDMGSVDLMVQVGAPPSVASGLQRIGRAGHQVGAESHGVVFPAHRGEIVAAAVVADRMRSGQIESLTVPANPLDVLAQHIVAMVAIEEWDVEDLATVVRRSAPFSTLGDKALAAVLDMLAGRYPSEDFGELRPRLVWDRVTGRLTGRPGALRLAVTSGGTIADRGLYGVFLADGADAPADAGPAMRGGKRVGELDEEMVYESRVGDTFTLGSSTWRIEDITHDRVLVSPAPGLPGRLPFWKGDSPGRPAELGKAVGAWTRELDAVASRDPGAARERLAATGLDDFATDNLLSYLSEQRTATGRVPSDRTVIVERFRDELGDWRVVVHSPFGARVHAPWALVLAGRLRDRYGVEGAVMHSDDGIVLRLPDVGQEWAQESTDALTVEDLLIDPQSLRAQVRDELGSSVMFAARFREAAARALLLPRRRPDRRQPLWQQRQRSAQLLSVASAYPQFPIVLEAARECLQDDFDVAALAELMRDLASGHVQLLDVTTAVPSPFAQSLLFGYTAQFLYDGDAPLAERRAAALSLDPALLAELLGEEGAGTQIADLLDPQVIEKTERELAGLSPERAARHAEDLWDILHRLGPLTGDQLRERVRPTLRAQVESWTAALTDSRRIIAVRLAGVPTAEVGQWAVADDAGRLRDALGVALPPGLPDAFVEPAPTALRDLVRRHARTHGPFTAASVASRFGVALSAVHAELLDLESEGILVHGRLRPESLGGIGDEWCDSDVMRLLRRRSLAALRSEVEPVPQQALARFLPDWQGVGQLRGVDGLLRAVEQMCGVPVPASALETLVLPARVTDYSPAMLDELTTSGEVVWCGHPGASSRGDGLVSLHPADWAPLTLPIPGSPDPSWEGPHASVLEVLRRGGGQFLDSLAAAVQQTAGSVEAALWDLAWAGLVTNDSFAAVRARLGAKGGTHRAPRQPNRARPMRHASLGGLGMALSARPRSAGRWSLLPATDTDVTRRAHALAGVLLDRHGVLTRAVATMEKVAGSFTNVYRVLTELENTGAARRGYFVEHLGGSQFAVPGAVDRLRELGAKADQAMLEPDGAPSASDGRTLCLAATDPANAYGGALAWPANDTGHRPGRKAGAVVVLYDGALALYVERGGRTVLTFTEGPALVAACRALAAAIRKGSMGKVAIKHINGREALALAGGAAPTETVASAFLAAGFVPTPSGLRTS